MYGHSEFGRVRVGIHYSATYHLRDARSICFELYWSPGSCADQLWALPSRYVSQYDRYYMTASPNPSENDTVLYFDEPCREHKARGCIYELSPNVDS